MKIGEVGSDGAKVAAEVRVVDIVKANDGRVQPHIGFSELISHDKVLALEDLFEAVE